MALTKKTVLDLDAAATFNGTELSEVVQSGASKKFTPRAPMADLPALSAVAGGETVEVLQAGVNKSIPIRNTPTAESLAAYDANGYLKNKQVTPNSGLQFAAQVNIPEYPDNLAGTTYINNNFTHADGWTATRCTLSYSGGKMIVTATDITPLLTRSVTASKAYIVKITRISGSATTSRINNSSGTVYLEEKTFPSSGEHIQNTYIGAGATGVINIFPGFAGSQAGDVYEISFIYIGDGTYDTQLLDQSGNGNNGTVYGSTPVDGGLSFDGVNDRVVCPVSLKDIFSISLIIDASAGTTSQRIFNAISDIFLLDFQTSSNSLRFYWTKADLNGDSISVPSIRGSGKKHVVAVHTGSLASLFIDGILVTSKVATLTTALISSVTLGSAVGGPLPYTGTIRDPRIYNRALSAAEIWELYSKPGAYNLDNVTKAVTPVPNSVSVRDANGNVGANGIKFPGTQAASTDANTLDDYEEGTFTPALAFGGLSVGITYSTQYGKYTKIGNLVFFSLYIVLTSKGTSTGSATIGGLPFTNSGVFTPVSINRATINAVDAPFAMVTSGGASVTLYEVTNAGVFTNITNADFADISSLWIAGTYSI